MSRTADTKSTREIGSRWPVLWLLWAAVTTLGWLGVAATSAVLGINSGIWNPDQVTSYLSRPPAARLMSNLIIGAIIGIMFGALFGVFQWKALGRTRKYAITTAALSMIGTAVLCATSPTGPARLQSDLMITLRSAMTGGILGGVFCGLCQWLLLIRRLPGMNRWPLMTTTGWAISWTALLWFPDMLTKGALAAGLILLPLAGGATVGLLQWLLLRRWLRQAGWWIPATAVGWVVPFWLSQVSGLSLWGYALAGVIPATTLVLLLRQLEPDTPPESTE